MGIRVSRPEVAPAIESMFAGHLVDDPDAPPNFSVRIGGFPEDDEPNPLHLLYRSRRQVVRSRTPSRVLRGLGAHVSALGSRQHPGHRTHGLVFVGPSGTAVVADPALLPQRAALQAALSRREIWLLDEPAVWVDLDAGVVHVPRSDVPLPEEAAALDGRFGGDGAPEAPPATSEPLPLAGWVVSSGRTAPPSQARSVAVAAVAETFMPIEHAADAARLLGGLDALVADGTVRWVPSTDRASIVEGVAGTLA